MKKSSTSVILSGGFGNVLLQIQFGRFLGSALGKEIIYNSTLVSPKVVIDVNALIGEPIIQNVYRFAGLHLSHRYFLGVLRHLKSWPFFVEAETDELLEPQKLKKFWYITGYFQSYKYSNGPLVVQEKLEGRVSKENLIRVSKLSQQDVIVHIRFGDYLNILTRNYHGIMPKSYYDKAIKSNFFGQRVIVITDDTSAAEAYFDVPNNVNVEIWSGRQFTALDDFYFMTCARNIIIGNSSFSFCAALQASRSRCTNVVAPRNWFANRSINERYRFPEDWNVV